MAKSFTYAILDWARSKPADEAYEYTDFSNCAVAQFLRDTGRAANPRVAWNEWRDGLDGDWHAFDRRIMDAAVGGPETFGGFANRLAELVSA